MITVVFGQRAGRYAAEALRVFVELKARHGAYRLVNQRLEQLGAGGR